jgi:uncharacterized protein YecT (DUF1311 family)
MSTHYDTLGVSPEAEDVVIEAAYKALIKRHHPDVQGGGDARAKAINDAYRVLRDAAARARYDRDLFGAAPAGSAAEAPTPPPSPKPPAHNGTAHAATAARGDRASWLFIGLAALVIIGALGSLAQGDTSRTVPPAIDPAAPAADADAAVSAADGGPAPPSAHEASAPAEAAVETPATEPSAPQPSFDCARATSDALRMICLVPELATADANLAGAYKQALETAADPGAVRQTQRAWLVRRDAAGADPQALLQLYNDRIRELAAPAAEEPIY